MLYLEMKKAKAAEPLCRKALEIHDRLLARVPPKRLIRSEIWLWCAGRWEILPRLLN